MRNLLIFSVICAISYYSISIGKSRMTYFSNKELNNQKPVIPSIPSIGKIEILNGCGISGVAGKIADFLRSKNFDVKQIANAETWNYQNTLIVSRKEDMKIANKIGEYLNIDKVFLLRDKDCLYDVSIFIGADIGDIINDKQKY